MSIVQGKQWQDRSAVALQTFLPCYLWLGYTRGGNSRDPPVLYCSFSLFLSAYRRCGWKKSQIENMPYTLLCPFYAAVSPFLYQPIISWHTFYYAVILLDPTRSQSVSPKPGSCWKADAVNMPSICVKAASEWSSGSILSSYSHSWTSVGDRLTTNLKTYVKPRSNRLQFSLHQNRILVVNNVCSRQGCKRPLKV